MLDQHHYYNEKYICTECNGYGPKVNERREMGVAYDWFSDLGFPGSVRRAIVRRYGNKGVKRTTGC